jgi:ABC-type glutathione transport system ATPase component
MPRRSLSKTQTIKDRTAYIYLPSIRMLEDWKKLSQAAKTSLSKFVIDRVEDSIRRDEGEEGYLGRIELVKCLKKAEEELKELANENRMLKKLFDNQETELKRYRSQPFLESGFEGIRRYDKELIELLKGGKSYSADEILLRLDIERSEVNLVKAINTQLETLEAYGLIGYSGRGWRWKT